MSKSTSVVPSAGVPDLRCPLPRDVWAGLVKNAKNLQCSPGLYLQLLIEKGVRSSVVTEQDVFLRTSDQKFAHSMLRNQRDQDLWRSWWGSLAEGERESIAKSLQAMAKRNDDAGLIEVWAPPGG
jgi:hypothetical protein